MGQARGRRVVAVALLAAGGLGAWRAGRRIEARAASALARTGVSAHRIRFSWFGPMRFERLERALPAGGRLAIDTLEVDWSVLGGLEARSHVSGLVLQGLHVARGPLSLEWPEAAFDVTSWTRSADGQRLALRQRGSGGTIELSAPAGGTARLLSLQRLDVDTLALQWKGETVMNPGSWTGRARWTRDGGLVDTDGAFQAEIVRLTPPRPLQPQGGEGLPTSMNVGWSLRVSRETHEVRRLGVRLRGIEITAESAPPSRERPSLRVKGRCDLGEAFRTAGLALPIQIPRAHALGRADLDLTVRGRPADPAALVLEPRLRFEAEPEAVRALAYLRAPFSHRPDMSPGIVIDLSEDNPDFIRSGDVPALLQRALLLSEDAGFHQHCGLDLAEVAAAWAEREEEGRVRGASTLTQQLVKNLFLSREKTYGRKVKEAALALLVDAAVPKERLLEIYLNIIEWGPRLHGLVPAARHYFGKRPGELTPKETAFLVCLIPNPVRYHQAHETGRLGPGMEQLVHNLLAKLRSVDALDEEQYEAALAEELAFAPES